MNLIKIEIYAVTIHKQHPISGDGLPVPVPQGPAASVSEIIEQLGLKNNSEISNVLLDKKSPLTSFRRFFDGVHFNRPARA